MVSPASGLRSCPGNEACGPHSSPAPDGGTVGRVDPARVVRRQDAPGQRVKVFDFFSGCGFSYSSGRFGHPEPYRAISVREVACLQTFPMGFRFSGRLNSRIRQIGNAVPTRLAEVIGHHAISHQAQKGEA